MGKIKQRESQFGQIIVIQIDHYEVSLSRQKFLERFSRALEEVR